MRNPFNYNPSDLTLTEAKEMERVQKTTSRMWRTFWVKVMHRKGYSNRQIAHEFEISESTVRRVLKGE